MPIPPYSKSTRFCTGSALGPLKPAATGTVDKQLSGSMSFSVPSYTKRKSQRLQIAFNIRRIHFNLPYCRAAADNERSKISPVSHVGGQGSETCHLPTAGTVWVSNPGSSTKVGHKAGRQTRDTAKRAAICGRGIGH